MTSISKMTDDELIEKMQFALRAHKKKANDPLFNHDDSVIFYIDPVYFRQLEQMTMMTVAGWTPNDTPRWRGIRLITDEWKYGLTPNVITLDGGTVYSPGYQRNIKKTT